MITSIIVVLCLINLIISIYLIKNFIKQRSVFGISFTIFWTLQYVIGNVFVLLSRDLTFGNISFAEFEISYLFAILIGQYFISIYSFLLTRKEKYIIASVGYAKNHFLLLLIFFIISCFFALLFILKVGISQYFSPELAYYRSVLGDYAGEGIGVYYYLAMMLWPSTLMIGSYVISYPTRFNILIAITSIIIASVVFIPIGGRGRVVNIILILFINYLINKGDYRIRTVLNFKSITLFSFIIIISFLWGQIREYPGTVTNNESTNVVSKLSVDLTRLQFQSYIFDRYSIFGTYWGGHYIESLLGPFIKYFSLSNDNLIKNLSSNWYADVINGFDIQSAISPSFIGEIYINFGILGLLISPFFFYLIIISCFNLFGNDNFLSAALIIYFIQFNIFNGGMYALFDMIVVLIPPFFINKYLAVRNIRIIRNVTQY